LWGKNRLGADCRQGIEKGQLWAKVKKKIIIIIIIIIINK